MFHLGKKRKELKRYLESGQHPYDKLIEVYSDVIYSIDYNGNFIEYNNGFMELTGYGQGELIGKGYDTVVHPEDLPRANEQFKRAKKAEMRRRQFRILHKSGAVKNVSVDAFPILSNDGESLGIFVIGKDITQEKELESIIRQQDNKFRALVKSSNDIISILDENRKVIYRSPSCEEVLGYETEEMPESIFTIIHPDDIEAGRQQHNELFDKKPNETVTAELRLKHKNGEWKYFQAIGTNLLQDPDIKGVVVILRDISSVKKAQQEVQYMAYYDYLTDLPNRRLFENSLELELKLARAKNTKLAVMFIDLDRFKYINDTLGHDLGDIVLKEVANTLKTCITEKDMVARWSGDGFILFVSNVKDEKPVKEMAKEIKRKLRKPYRVKNHELFITASIGISTFPDSSEDIKSLMQNAYLAMCLIKENGKNHYQFYTPKMDIQDFKTFSLQNDLHKALIQNQFEVYYQPKVSGQTKQIVGAEALIRWNHSEWGIVPPDEFIRLAEESGLIISIGEWIFREVCHQIKKWMESGIEPIKVSVNFSPIQFLQKDLVETISSILRESNIDGKWLEIEITESTFLENEDEITNKLRALEKLGIKIALDDFGTGYSSLGYLRKYRFSTIKLDKSFVRDIHTNQESAAIIKFITDLCKQLKINIVAEGVEYEEQLELLQQLECDQLQGYLFSKPQPISEFEKLLTDKIIPVQTTGRSGQERRKDFRVKCAYPLELDMTIVELNKKKLRLGKTYVLGEDIGPGGLRFTSDIRLPIDVDIVLKFTTRILGSAVSFLGRPVWYKETGSLHEYGIKFILEDKERSEIIRIFNQMQLKMKQNPLLEDTSFVTKNMQEYFQKS